MHFLQTEFLYFDSNFIEVHLGLIDKSTLVQVMAWHLLSEPMLTRCMTPFVSLGLNVLKVQQLHSQ